MSKSKENELNERERKHYEMLKREETKWRNNAEARHYLEISDKEKNIKLMELRLEKAELQKQLEAIKNNEYVSNVKDKNVVQAKSFQGFIKIFRY